MKKHFLKLLLVFWLTGGYLAYQMTKADYKRKGYGWNYQDVVVNGFCCLGASWFIVAFEWMSHNNIMQKQSPF